MCILLPSNQGPLPMIVAECCPVSSVLCYIRSERLFSLPNVQVRVLLTALDNLHDIAQLVFGYFVLMLNQPPVWSALGCHVKRKSFCFSDTPATNGTPMLLSLLFFPSSGASVCFVGLFVDILKTQLVYKVWVFPFFIFGIWKDVFRPVNYGSNCPEFSFHWMVRVKVSRLGFQYISLLKLLCSPSCTAVQECFFFGVIPREFVLVVHWFDMLWEGLHFLGYDCYPGVIHVPQPVATWDPWEPITQETGNTFVW